MFEVLLLSYTSLLLSIQYWMMVAFALSFCPVQSSLNQIVLPEFQYLVRPEREGFLFHLFIILALLFQAGSFWFVSRKYPKAGWAKKIMPFAIVETAVVFLLASAAFKMIVYNQKPRLAQNVFVMVAVAACAVQIFWPRFLRVIRGVNRYVTETRIVWWMDATVIIGLGLLLYIPDDTAALARMFLGDQFHHFDSFMAPIWAFSKGCVLNRDIITEYGIGIAAFTTWLAKIAGGISYHHIFYIWVWEAIVYFILCYFFLRFWLGSLGISVAVLLWSIKIQMFNPGVDPFVFTLPSTSVVRYWWDIVLFLCLAVHLKKGQSRWLLASGVVCGVSIFYMPTCGYCLAIAYLVYLALLGLSLPLRRLALKDARSWGFWGLSALLIPLTTGALLFYTNGPSVFTSQFWYNMGEFNNYFLAGFGLMPMTETLQNKEVLTGLMGFFIPVAYMLTFMVTTAEAYYGIGKKENVLASVISFYGLVLYHYYVARSAPTNYYVVGIPYVFVLGFWLKRGLMRLERHTARRVVFGVVCVVVYALATNHTYMKYPNVLSVSRNPIIDPQLIDSLPDGRSYFNQQVTKLTESDKLPFNSLGQKDEDLHFEKDFKDDAGLKAYYQREFDFSQDTDLIDRLTKPQDAAAVLSNFEIKMLMQADRKPYFYYLPLVQSWPMHVRAFPLSTMYTLDHAKRILQNLQENPPPYIFVEKLFLNQAYWSLSKDQCLLEVLSYITGHYQLVEQGKYLAAMKRKDDS